MTLLTAILLAMTTIATIAVMWVRQKWATSIPEVATCLLAVVWAVAGLSGKRKLRFSWVLLPLAGIVALAGLQLVTGSTVYSWPTRVASYYWAGNLAVVFVGLQLFQEPDDRRRYTGYMVWFGALVAIFSTIQAATSDGLVYWKFPDKQVDSLIFGPFLYVNQFAAFVEILLPLGLYGAMTQRRGRIWYVLATAAMSGAIIYGGSRGGAGLVALELVLVPLLVAWRVGIGAREVLNGAIVVGALLLCIAAVADPDKLIYKAKLDWASGRREFNVSSVAMIKARPLTGFGLGNWATAYPGYATFDDGKHANQAHNDWLQWTAEGGIPMLLLMLSIAVWAIPRAIRSIWGFGVAVIFIHCLWDYPIQRTGVAIVFFTMMAAIAPYGKPSPEDSPQYEAE